MYVFQVLIVVTPGSEEEFAAVTVANRMGSLQEPGCSRFDVLQHADDPTKFTLYEAWADEAALAAHKETEHYKVWAEVCNRVQTQPRTKQVFIAHGGL